MPNDIFRQQYRPLTGDEQEYIRQVKARAEALRMAIASVPPSREQSLAITNLQQAVFWATAGVTG